VTAALVLLSGGQDSTTCLFWAKERLPGVTELHALNLLYGQRHRSEIVAAAQIAKLAGCASYLSLDVSHLMFGSKSALIDQTGDLKGDGGMRDPEAPNGLPTSFVPGRNLMMLGLAVARAGVVGATHIVTGVCQTDYSGYPDCREQFITAMQGAVAQAWPGDEPVPIIHTPLMHRTKAETVKLARELPGCWEALGKSVTCYLGQRPGCGECPACHLRVKGFAEAGFLDPSEVIT
jgi:7-cyano-7-deazaguanine synthase